MGDGQITARAAEVLSEHYVKPPWRVFYDHGGDASQRIYSWFETAENVVSRANILSWIDIVVADPASGKVHAIIEIEDTTAKPKTMIGDAMAVLMGDGLAIGERSDWKLDETTCLIVLLYTKGEIARKKYQRRLEHIQAQLRSLQGSLKTGNAAIGRIEMDTFTTEGELQAKLLAALSSLPDASARGEHGGLR